MFSLNLKKNKKTKLEKICENINNKCIQACECYVGSNEKNIIRIFNEYSLYKLETEVYLKLIKSKNKNKIVPFINGESYKIEYIIEEYSSLRNFLEEKKNKSIEQTNLIINELYSFINTFKKHKFVHGNLHIDNIFIKKINDKNYDFKVIDYANSYIKTNTKSTTSTTSTSSTESTNNDIISNKTSFLGEYKKKEKDEYIIYWDFFTIYVSLKNFYKNKVDKLYKLQNIAEEYIPKDIFNNLINDIILEQFSVQFNSKIYE